LSTLTFVAVLLTSVGLLRKPGVAALRGERALAP
jgi:hypothetical protein